MKRKRKAGRPAREGVDRFACGKIKPPSQEEIEARNRAQVVAQRVKHHGLTKTAANDQAGGSVIGRLYLMGSVNGLSQDQYLAAQRIAEARHDAGKAILKPTVRSGSDFGGVRGHDASDGSDASYADWVARVTRRWKDIRSAILAAGPLAMMAVEMIVVEDKEPKGSLGDLRLALNAVHRLHSTGRA
jgi:hypothetical protein